MSEVLESAKGHFKSKMSGGLECIEVPEWEVKGKPTKLYFRPSINFVQQQKIITYIDDKRKGDALVESLIQRALDADGNRVFKEVHRSELMRHVDPDVVARIVGAMAGVEEEYDHEEIEKN